LPHRPYHPLALPSPSRVARPVERLLCALPKGRGGG
jgi:hypothetical protein